MENILAGAKKVAEEAEVFMASSEEMPVHFETNRLKHIQRKQSTSVALRLVKQGKVGYATATELENQNLVEHESFTELLRALFHLRDELFARGDLFSLPDTDIEHLANDARRVYIVLGEQWIDHMRYLKRHYPYLFSLALRTNPFNVHASPIVTE